MKNRLLAGLFAAGVLTMSGSALASGQVYGKLGFLGAGVGYAYGLNSTIGLRADVTTAGSFSHDGHASHFDYSAKLRNNVATAYVDYFPFNNGFRLSAGLGVRNTKIDAHARPNSAGEITIGDTTVSYGPGDSADARAKMPNVAPYLGLGWGHNVGQQRKKGFGFIADVGVYFGKPDVSFNVSDSLYAKLNLATGGNADAEIAKQHREIKDEADKIKAFPAVYLGVSYTF